MSSRPAVFLDRDGTIIEDVGYIKRISEVTFFTDTIGSLKLLQKHFLLFIITNQSGIAKGLSTIDEVNRINDYIQRYLHIKGVKIYDIFCCPHKNDDKCNCKKPSPFFLFEAERLYNVDLKRSFIIGDHPTDVQCGLNAGVSPVYLLTGHGQKHLNELTVNVKIFQNLLDSANYIVSTVNTYIL